MGVLGIFLFDTYGLVVQGEDAALGGVFLVVEGTNPCEDADVLGFPAGLPEYFAHYNFYYSNE